MVHNTIDSVYAQCIKTLLVRPLLGCYPDTTQSQRGKREREQIIAGANNNNNSRIGVIPLNFSRCKQARLQPPSP